MSEPTTLRRFLIRYARLGGIDLDLLFLIEDVASACRVIGKGLRDAVFEDNRSLVGDTDDQGEDKKEFDVFTDEVFVWICEHSPRLATLVSEEREDAVLLQDPETDDYQLVFDPLDGSSHIDVNLSVGSIFSICMLGADGERDLLEAGKEQRCSGCAIDRPTMMFVLNVGSGVFGFFFEYGIGDCRLTHPQMTIPANTSQFAISVSRYCLWHPLVRRNVDECLTGATGPCRRDFNMRWTTSMVAEVHRILTREGVFFYPADAGNRDASGKLRLLYEARPIAFLVEQASGAATNECGSILGIQPQGDHLRVPVILGSSEKVTRLAEYHIAETTRAAFWRMDIKMALVSLRQLLDHSAEHGYALPAFYVNNIKQMLVIMAAANVMQSPVVMQASQGIRAFANFIVLPHLIRAAIELYPHIPVYMRQDHGKAPAMCLSAITNGFFSVMMDDSLKADDKTPTTFEKNVAVTVKVAEMAHPVGVSVEGEIGHLGSLETLRGEAEDGHGLEGTLSSEQLLTDPEEAAEIVRLGGVDALAVTIGTSHRAYKFTRKPDGEFLATDRLREIHARLPDTHLVMHGSSSVPQEFQDIIHAHGGVIAPIWGVKVEEIQQGIRFGVRKVNLDTDLRLALTGAIRTYFAKHFGEFDPRRYLAPGLEAICAVCGDRFEQCGSAGLAPWIKLIALSDMAVQYARQVTRSTAAA